MPSCFGIKADGVRCKGQAIRGSEWCFSHHPDYEDRRRRRASKGGKRGGRGRPNGDTVELRGLLAELYTNVLAGAVQPNVAAVAAQIANARIRLVETERRIRETEELERRLEELETLLGDKDQERWG